MVLLLRPRVCDEIGQLADGHVDLHHAAARLPVLDVAHEVVGQLVALQLVQERDLRVHCGDDRGGRHLLAVRQRHAGRPAPPNQYLRHLGVRTDLTAERLGRSPACGGYAAHAALGEAPRSEVPVAHVPNGVVEHDVRGARLVWSCPGPDDPVDR